MVYKLEPSSTSMTRTRSRLRTGHIAQLWTTDEEKHAIVIGDNTTDDHRVRHREIDADASIERRVDSNRFGYPHGIL